jgi:hypothetical protein
MINNATSMLDIITFDYSQQTGLDNNDYIEIDDSITNFEQLIQQQNFNLIRNQYKQSIKELSRLYYYFSRLECKDSVAYTIETIYSTEKTLYSDLFYSYKQTRKHIIAIINYLKLCEENRLENNHTAIICGKLADCFGFCLSGFNSKITDINDYINIYSNLDFRSKINLIIKKILQEVIRDVLLKFNSKEDAIFSSNVHHQNAFFNLVADDFNLDAIIDIDAHLHKINLKTVETIVNQIKNKLPKIIICEYITDYLYSVFIDCLVSIEKQSWQNSMISDLTMEDTSYLENNFITPINNYLCIKNQEQALKISDLFLEKELGCYELSDIKDVLYYLLANNINSIIKLSSNINNQNKLIINIDSNINVYNIYDCYFYVLFNKDREVLTLQHLSKLNLDSIQFNLYLPMFIQALRNSKKEDIYVFFNTIRRNEEAIIKKNIEYISVVINNYTRENSTEQKRIVNAVTIPYIKKQKKIDFLLYRLMINNVLTNSIIEKLLQHEIDITSLFKLFTEKHLRNFIANLNNESILKIISRYINVNAIKKESNYIINKCITENANLSLLEKVDYKLIDDYLISLNDTRRKQLLEDIINNDNRYRLAKYLINYFIKYDIRDKEKNSILHKIVLHNDQKTLQAIIKNLDVDTINQLQFAKNDKQQIPLVYAIGVKKDRKDIITILLNNNKNIVNEPNKFRNTAFICTAVYNKPEYAEIILKYCDNNAINKTNDIHYNALMEASANGYDQTVKFLLTNIKGNDTFILTEDKNGNNALMLAIINKHESCAMLHIENYNSKILLYRNKNKNNALMLATHYNMLSIVKKILTKYSHNDIIKASKESEYNSFMLSIRRKNSQLTKLFLENISCMDLNKRDNQGRNALNLAINFDSNYLEEIIKLSSVKQVTNIFFHNGASDSLAQACYHGLDDKIITALIEKFTNKKFTKEQKSVVALLQAFEQGHLHCIKILHKHLTAEDFINTQDKNGNSCLVISIKNNYYDCAQYIMDNFTPDAIKKMMAKFYDYKINRKMTRIIGK